MLSPIGENERKSAQKKKKKVENLEYVSYSYYEW